MGLLSVGLDDMVAGQTAKSRAFERMVQFMNWETPQVEEISLSPEINSYCNGDF
jgi:coenzyme PQQ precursor peptide PqqA